MSSEADTPNRDLVKYYSDRASEYESIYYRPERQDQLLSLRKRVKELFAGQNVIEIACGTGYWTEVISETAESIHATDINEPVLEVARNRGIKTNNVKFEREDIYALAGDKSYDSLFGGFILSHIPLQKIDAFLSACVQQVKPGGRLVLIDNIYVEGSSTPIAEADPEGNTYQMRTLKDGTTHTVLKNFFSNEKLRVLAEKYAGNIVIENYKYYWLLITDVK